MAELTDEEVDAGDGYIGFKEFIVWWKSELAALVSSSEVGGDLSSARELGDQHDAPHQRRTTRNKSERSRILAQRASQCGVPGL